MGKKVQNKLAARNKPLGRVRGMFILMFTVLCGYIIYYSLFVSPDEIMNDYNPRLAAIENEIVRGDILDRNGIALATSRIQGEQVTREYPYDNAFSHVVGYTGHGKTGLEAYGHIDLLKTNSTFLERLKWSVIGEKPKANSMVTTLDKDLQLMARELLGDNKGAIVAMEPATGKILTMVSTPDFDPNDIEEIYSGISTDSESAALLNRATQGLYPPGSTYKVVTTIAHLEHNPEADFFYYCMGEDIIGQKVIHCYNSTAHGRLHLDEAFAKSCNTSYATIGQDLDPDRLKAISEIFGYNKAIDLEIESSVSQFVLDSNSSGPEVSETAIGQGKTLVTPLTNLMVAAAIANDGVLMPPYLVDRFIDDDGTVIAEQALTEPKTILTPDMASLLQRYMKLTTEEGTAKALKNNDYSVSGKTGSAENPFGLAHAWFIGYAPAEAPEIAIAIVIENVGSSTINAVPVAKELFDTYLK